ncbi:MAG: DUF262 domain-containing protein [Erythrobacter sp.]|nr:MAG: DUF262 domain-containing protein [Erythrobacter sp.]
MREPRKFTIKQLVSSNSQFVIPRYQRGYDWKGDTQVKDLFTDLIQCLESNYDQDLFLGSMIFDVADEKSGNQVEIIDGQQRFTTIIIALIAARDFAKNVLQNPQLALNIQNDIQNSDVVLGSSFNRLKASETIRDVFDIMCAPDWDTSFPDSVFDSKTKKTRSIRRQVSRVEPIYKYAATQISDLCEGKGQEAFIKFVKQLQHQTYIIRIDVDDKSEAFEIFERTNARGKPLEVSDLLKNFLFSRSKELDDAAEEIWDRVSEYAGNNILRVLKYFWISRRGPVANRDLYRNLRSYAAEIGVNEFVNELQNFSEYYAAFYSNERKTFPDWMMGVGVATNMMYLTEISRSVAALRLFNVTQPLPLIYAAVSAFTNLPQDGRDPKDLINLVRYLESYHYINNKICRRIGNEVERTYASHSDRLYNGDDFKAGVNSLLEELKERTASREEFSANFGYLSYESLNDRAIIRYTFDRIANKAVKEGQRISLVDFYGAEAGAVSEFDIEHLLAQSSATDEDSVVHDIGNLIVMPKQINGILGSDSPEQKIEKLLHPANFSNNIKNVPQYIYEFAEYAQKFGSWDENAIKERTHYLADQVYQDARFGYAYK